MKKNNGRLDEDCYRARVAGGVIGTAVLLAVVVVVGSALTDPGHQSQVLNLCCDVIKITVGAAVGWLFSVRF